MHSARLYRGTKPLNTLPDDLDSTKLTAAATRSALTLAVLCVLLTLARPAYAQTETVLHKLTGTRDGYNFTSSLTPDGAGNFYGTDDVGGPGFGTVFELSPNGRGGWKQTVLHTFTDGADGGFPFFSTVIFDKKGNLYGTTSNGGANEFGVVFKLHPTGKGWVETVLYSFASGEGGVYPFNGLIMDAAGNLYGRDYVYKGIGIFESVFELSPSGGGWKEKVIYSGALTGNADGGGLTMDAHGNIFGVTWSTFAPTTAFELSPNGKGGWNSAVIYTFGTGTFPVGALLLDTSGNLYGTISSRHSVGTVYKLSPRNKRDWKLNTLYTFKGGSTDGGGPGGGLTFDSAGNIYGTTTYGGQFNKGTVFELTPAGEGAYREKLLWSFNGKDGGRPFLSSLVLDKAGNLFGTTPTGGGTGCYAFEGCGVVFEVAP
jgi:uncharacterized repeat protein (TIGR03803 family)